VVKRANCFLNSFMDYKLVLGTLAIVIGIIGYIPYFRGIFLNTIKPHIFSWFAWGLLEAIAFFAQISKGAGAGAWVTGLTALICFTVAGLSIVKGEKQITRSDWLSFAGALLGIIAWQTTKNPLTAVILVSLVDAVAFIPTFKKAFNKPQQESVFTFSSSIIKLTISLFALESYSLTTWLYPATIVLTNTLFVTMLLFRRRAQNKIKPLTINFL